MPGTASAQLVRWYSLSFSMTNRVAERMTTLISLSPFRSASLMFVSYVRCILSVFSTSTPLINTSHSVSSPSQRSRTVSRASSAGSASKFRWYS
ncbi:hypothetical protein [Bacillus sp. FJAT-26390]|uniref:hypothetical protein n=1 Tax=Bacillus sp. FJAT-26390 TaxID=1743142 RepID=UPI00350E411E